MLALRSAIAHRAASCSALATSGGSAASEDARPGILPAAVRSGLKTGCLSSAGGWLGYRTLHDLMRLWRLTAAAYSEPGFEARLAGVREAVRIGSLEGSVPIEEVVPDWPDRLNRR